MTKIFKTEHAETSKEISREAVWQLWSDVNHWPNWDVGLSACKLEGPFAKNQTFFLTPQGNPEAIPVTLQEVIPLQSFADITELPFGKLETFHRMEDTAQGLKVTHTITATVDEAKADFFAKVIWSGMEKGVLQSVKNIVKLSTRQ